MSESVPVLVVELQRRFCLESPVTDVALVAVVVPLLVVLKSFRLQGAEVAISLRTVKGVLMNLEVKSSIQT